MKSTNKIEELHKALPLEVKLPNFISIWCCDCGLRHIYYVDVKLYKEEIWLYMDGFRDDVATKMKKKIKRLK